MTTLCPECKLEKCMCPVIDSVVGKAQAIDEVTREMAMGEADRFAQFVTEDLDLTMEEVESIRKEGTAINPDGFTEELMKEARRMANWDAWRQEFAESSVIGLMWGNLLTDWDKEEFLPSCGIKA